MRPSVMKSTTIFAAIAAIITSAAHAQPSSSVPEPVLMYAPGIPWTPVDLSGANLAFSNASGTLYQNGNFVALSFSATYPSTADTSPAVIGPVPNFLNPVDFASGQCSITFPPTQDNTVVVGSNVFIFPGSTIRKSGGALALISGAGGFYNAALSGVSFTANCLFPLATPERH
jgi:hypothetical protein